MQHAVLLLGKVWMSHNFLNFLMNYLEIESTFKRLNKFKL